MYIIHQFELSLCVKTCGVVKWKCEIPFFDVILWYNIFFVLVTFWKCEILFFDVILWYNNIFVLVTFCHKSFQGVNLLAKHFFIAYPEQIKNM